MSEQGLKACHCCGLIHRVPELSPEQRASCARCGTRLQLPREARRNAARTAAAAVGAFVLFWPAILLPIVEIEELGHRSGSSILFGTIELLSHGDWFVGGVVLVFSIIFPLLKICLLLELSLLQWLARKHKALTYRAMEHAGRWSMMDVLLLAFLVMLVKLGNLVTFHFGPAVVAFVFCVVLNMIASFYFDPHGIWDEDQIPES
ncbi:MAG: paraquat-inducible protein A [Planctomycetota bacterium]